MRVLLKIVGVFGMTVVLMAVGSVSAEDQSTTILSGTTVVPQRIPLPIPIPGIPGGGGTTANGGGGSGGVTEPCSGC